MVISSKPTSGPEYSAAEQEVANIMQEINAILAGAQDRAKAERLLLKTHADRIDVATQKARELLKQWIAHVHEVAKEE